MLDFSKYLDYAAESAKKYGKFLFVIVALWLGLKKIWFWVIMPLFCIAFLKQLSLFFGWTMFTPVNPMLMIMSWIFVFTLLKGLFERK